MRDGFHEALLSEEQKLKLHREAFRQHRIDAPPSVKGMGKPRMADHEFTCAAAFQFR
jgi:hypothetical protein